MEGWENKILSDKLNSLQDLPAGYSPNLSAKWEIVEAGLPVAEKQRIMPLVIRWSAAAAVLLAIGLVWMNTGGKKQIGLIMENTITNQLPLQKQPPQSPKVLGDSERSSVFQPSHKTATLPVDESTKQHNQLAFQQSAAIPVRGDTNQGIGNDIRDTNQSSVSNINSTVSLSLPVDSIASGTIQQTTVAASLDEKPRPAKKRIYQRDFNDGTLVLDTGFAPASRQHFSIQLKPFSRKTADGGETADRRLQLKQVL